MNILAIDYGEARIGLALGSTDICVALPRGVVHNASTAVSEIARIVADERVSHIILGLPRYADGNEHILAPKVHEFGVALHTATGVILEYVDERFTSQAADRMGGAGGASRDEKSAMILLEEYFFKEKKS